MSYSQAALDYLYEVRQEAIFAQGRTRSGTPRWSSTSPDPAVSPKLLNQLLADGLICLPEHALDERVQAEITKSGERVLLLTHGIPPLDKTLVASAALVDRILDRLEEAGTHSSRVQQHLKLMPVIGAPEPSVAVEMRFGDPASYALLDALAAALRGHGFAMYFNPTQGGHVGVVVTEPTTTKTDPGLVSPESSTPVSDAINAGRLPFPVRGPVRGRTG